MKQDKSTPQVRGTDAAPDYPCTFCRRGKAEGCTLSQFPKYGDKCKELARKKRAAQEANDTRRAKKLGMYRNRDEIWCIKHPVTGRAVISGRYAFEPALMVLARDFEIRRHIEAAGIAASTGDKHTTATAKPKRRNQ